MSDKPKIWLSSPHMGGEEEKFVQEAFDTNWIAPLGPNVDGFEKDLEQYTGVSDAAVLISGTSAIHLALVILGVKQGDEVLVSSFTFSGSINPVIYQGATPVMIDSEMLTWNIDPELMEEAILDRIAKTGKAPKAAIIVHLYGMPAQIDRICEICRKYNVAVIEDAAEALGSSFKGQKLGSFGDFGILSFNGNKIITTSGGGALLSNNTEWVEKARFLSTQARDPAPHYQHSEIGYNYRMSNVVAGIGRGQMKVLDQWVAKRRENHSFYDRLFSGYKGIEILKETGEEYFSNHWLSAIVIDPEVADTDREKLRLALADQNIESRPLWKPMHMQPAYEKHPSYSNGVAEFLFHNGLCLPSGSNLVAENYERIESTIRRFFSNFQ